MYLDLDMGSLQHYPNKGTFCTYRALFYTSDHHTNNVAVVINIPGPFPPHEFDQVRGYPRTGDAPRWML